MPHPMLVGKTIPARSTITEEGMPLRFSRSMGLPAAMLLLCGCGTVAAATFEAAPGDFNQDGQTDLAVLGSGEQVGNQTRYRLEVFHGGATHPVVLDTFEASGHSKLVARDIDGDQDADL